MQRNPMPLLTTLLLALPYLVSSTSDLHGQAAAPDMLVTSRFTNEVLRYDGTSGAFAGVFASAGGLFNPVGLSFGADGNLYVASAANDRVLRYDGTNGGFLGVFAQGGGLDDPRQLNFGPDGHLYVANAGTNQILRFDGRSGASLGVFSQGGSLFGPTSFSFGPDGDLYVVSVLTNKVKRYDGESGAFLGNLVSSTVSAPHDVGFGPDGNFYVVSANQTQVRRFDPTTGAFIDNYINDGALRFPLGMQWDGAGRFYVVNQGRNEIRRYDDQSGQLESILVAPNSGGLDSPLFMTFFPPAGGPQIEDALPGVAGTTNYLRISGFEPGRKALLFIGTQAPSMQVLRCGLRVGLSSGMLLWSMSLDESGAGVLGGFVPLCLAGVTLHAQAFAIRSCESSQVAALRF